MSYDAVAALEENCTALKMKCLAGKDGNSVILPKFAETFQYLQDVAVNCSTTRVKLIQLDSYINTMRGVGMSFLLRLSSELLHHL